MRLHYDCVRELLLYLEEKLSFNDTLDVSNISIGNFSEEEILYTAMKLSESEYIKAKIFNDITGQKYTNVFSITWKGHKFIDTIRDNQVWSKTKKFLNKISSFTLDVIEKVASAIIAEQINQHL